VKDKSASIIYSETNQKSMYSFLLSFNSNSALTSYCLKDLVENGIQYSIMTNYNTSSDVNKDFSHKDQDQDKDLWIKDFKKFTVNDKDQDLTVKDKDKDFGIKDKDNDKDVGRNWSLGQRNDFKGRLNSKNLHKYI